MYLWNDIALIEDDSHFTPWVKEAGKLVYDFSLLERMRPYLKGTVVEVGANIGTHTPYYAEHAERVIAFEPLAAAMDCLRYNTRDLKNVELYYAAVGRVFGSASMVTPEKNYGASFTVPGDSLPVVSIDSLCLDSCNFIKIDAEGDEIEILAGAQRTIATYEPVMCIECNRSTLNRKGLTHDELLDCIEQLGYAIHGYQDEVCCDLICVPTPSEPL